MVRGICAPVDERLLGVGRFAFVVLNRIEKRWIHGGDNPVQLGRNKGEYPIYTLLICNGSKKVRSHRARSLWHPYFRHKSVRGTAKHMKVLVINPGGKLSEGEDLFCQKTRRYAFEGESLLSVGIEGIGKEGRSLGMKARKWCTQKPSRLRIMAMRYRAY
jgi:hypothetical protein